MPRKILLPLLVLMAAPLGAQQAPPAQQASPAVKLVPEMPPAAPPRPFHFPESVTRTLPNGLRVFVVPARAGQGRAAVEPAVSIELLIRNAGTASDPEGKPGVAALTASLLTEGTEKRTAQQIAEAIDFVGGSLSADAGSDATTLRAGVVKKDFALGMDLLSDIALHAAFAPQEIARQRQQLLSGLRVQYSDASYLASAVFRRVVFGANSYGLPAEGTPEVVRSLTRADLVAFRDRFYSPDQALLAFAGDITPEEAFAAAEKYFGSWPKKSVPAAPTVALPQPHGLRIVLVDKPDAVQTQIRVGRPGIERSHPDYLPLLVTNQIFGGGYNSRLNTEVRLKKGLTYGASSRFVSYLRGGVFQANTFTRTEATVETTRLVVDEIARMTSDKATEDELNVARDYLAGVFAIGSETPEQVASRVVTAAFYGLPDDYNQTYQQKVRAVSPRQVERMAARYFDAADLDLVLVGNASAFRDALGKAFPKAKLEEIPVAQLDLLSPGLRRKNPAPAQGPKAPASMPR